MSPSSSSYKLLSTAGEADEDRVNNSRISSTIENRAGDDEEEGDDDETDIEGGENAHEGGTVANNVLVPITRRPTSARDAMYAVLFIAQFVVISLLSLLEQGSLRDSLVTYTNAGSFSSMFMLVILLSSLLGGAVVFVLANDDIRESMLSHGILLSVSFQVCLGNIMLLAQSRFSWIGVVVLLMAYIDSRRYQDARAKVSFTSALLKLVIDVCEQYGISLCIACFAIVAAQACALLWWGVLFIGLISGASLHSGYAELLIIVMGLSLYWITQFFHAFMSYVVGGCVLWYFLDNDRISSSSNSSSSSVGAVLPYPNVGVLMDDGLTTHAILESSLPTGGEDPSGRVMFSMSLGLSTSFGSIAKGALFSPPAEAILAANGHSAHRPTSGLCSCTGPRACVERLVPQATQNSRLAMTFAAIYGKTYSKSAYDVVSAHAEVIDIAVEDATSFSLCSIAKDMGITMAVFFGILAERREGQDWPLFFLVSYALGYCSISLALHVYSAAVDAIIIAYAARPDQLRNANSIIFLRFLRTTETELR